MNDPSMLLSTQQSRELCRICCEYEQAWAEGNRVLPADFPVESTTLDRELVLFELNEVYRELVKVQECYDSQSKSLPVFRDDRYQVTGEISRGGAAVVYRVRDSHLVRDLAIKCLLDSQDNHQMRIRLQREARLCAGLVHPGIVPIHELSSFKDGRPFVIMKLVEGKTLQQLLKSDTPLKLSEAVEILAKVCQALAFAHQRGIIHRDLKPSNIMVGAFGEVQIMDWGLAKELNYVPGSEPPNASSPEIFISGESTENMTGEDSTFHAADYDSTTHGLVLGTIAYMSPEQALGANDRVDRRSDVFALGAILCRILLGQPPYRADDSTELLEKAQRADLGNIYQRLRSHPHKLLAALAISCLAADPDQRPNSAGEVAEVLAQLSRKKHWSSSKLKSVLGLGCALMIVPAFWWLQFTDRPDSLAELPATNRSMSEVASLRQQNALLLDADQIQKLVSEKDYETVAAHYAESIRKDPSNFKMLCNVWRALSSTSRYKESLDVAKRLQQLDSGGTLSNCLMAESCYLNGMFDRACEHMQVACESITSDDPQWKTIQDRLSHFKKHAQMASSYGTIEAIDALTASSTSARLFEVSKCFELSGQRELFVYITNRALEKENDEFSRSIVRYQLLQQYVRQELKSDLTDDERDLICRNMIEWFRKDFEFARSGLQSKSAHAAGPERELMRKLKDPSHFSFIRQCVDDVRLVESLRVELSSILKSVDDFPL